MLEKGKINAGEFLVMVVAFTIGSSILVVPAPGAETAKQDAWIAAVITTFTTLFIIFVFNQLATLYSSMTYVEYNEKIYGKWIGKILTLPYLFYVFLIACGQLRDIGDFFTTEILVDTPIQMIMIIFALTSLIGVRLGLEVICRSAVIFFPWIIILIVLLCLLIIPHIKLENIQPVFGEGLKPIIKNVYINWGQTLQMGIFLMIMPYVTKKEEMKKSFYKGFLIGGIVMTTVITLSILVLGASMTARQTYPTYMLAKKISIGTFLQRIEVIVAIIWMLTVYFKLTICYYALSLGLAQLFGLKSYKLLTFPLAFLIIPFAIFMSSNIVSRNQYITKALPPFSFTICFMLSLLLLVIGKIKLKRSASKATKQPLN
ncbi:endospore germination permease [Bacillus sp. EB600]|uniref:GerAB/ArcD/ProY family transporter n=1 Tax=Bacillus sp. EB600 TaxID=2806345 RepID=UPI00210B33A7|nr:endospore germination permease [Bacillus sp. EB600]MCQ6280813.1 endospore germination permease [Bacillus sp. EB600]